MIRARIASVIARKREEGIKITQAEIAEKMGVSPQQMSAWVTGKKVPRLETAFELAHIIGCKVDELYERIPN
ncbi:helix-turn-helix transcriptional regulator [Melghirimyces algeriensis]|uniref:Putative transcriptional regulator n=1 Tax=Melghirimyces algeriensis TaxID=910412 RepID=A0A521F4S8_9BACL|nr:helix-turn-helix transcriptional regulator [Melghirimyces algeriensis]SMO91056.1 putative transcriptional regulator [Melghirimyces algeriensis]